MTHTSNELQAVYLCPSITTSEKNNYLLIHPLAYVDLQSNVVFVTDGLHMGRRMVGGEVEGVFCLSVCLSEERTDKGRYTGTTKKILAHSSCLTNPHAP
jgi:hypothetical protein